MDSEEDPVAEGENFRNRGLGLSLDGSFNGGLSAQSDETLEKSSAKRKRIGAGQLEVLEEVFRTTHHPSLILRNRIAARLDLSLRSVQIWFQNRRAKAKKNGPQDPYEKETTLLHNTPHLSSSLSLGPRDKEGDHSRLIEMLTSDESPNKRAKLQQELLRELEKEKQKKDANAKKALGTSPNNTKERRERERDRGKLKDREKEKFSSAPHLHSHPTNHQLSLSVTSTIINYNSAPVPNSTLHSQYSPRGPSTKHPSSTAVQHMNQIQQHLHNNSHDMSSDEQFRLNQQLEALQGHIRFDGPTSPLNFSSAPPSSDIDSFYNSYGELPSSHPHTHAHAPQQRPYHAEHVSSNQPFQSTHLSSQTISYPQFSALPYSHYSNSAPPRAHTACTQLQTPSYPTHTHVKEELGNRQPLPPYSHQQHLVLTSPPSETGFIQQPQVSTSSYTPTTSSSGSSSVYLMVKNEPTTTPSERSPTSPPQSSHSPSSPGTINPSALSYPPLNYSLAVNSSFLKSN